MEVVLLENGYPKYFMDGNGNIELEAPKDITFNAGENINMNAGQNMTTTIGLNKTDKLGMETRESQAPSKEGALKQQYRKREIHHG